MKPRVGQVCDLPTSELRQPKLPLNAEARAVLDRRGFLKSAGGLIVGFHMFAGRSARAQFGQAALSGSPPSDQLDSWIAIGADGSITAFSGKEELGQGISTAQQQLVAEELSVPFERVTLIYCDTARTPDQAYTSGSQSHPANFNHANLAQAAATAREALVKMAAQRLSMPVEKLTAAGGAISVKGDPSKKVSYGELAGGKKLNLALDKNAKRKPPGEWTVLGKPIGRPDMAAMATGQFEFVHNVRLPGMLHGRVVRPPAVGATLVSVDEASVKGLPGLVKVVVKKNFVGVVAEKPWQAIQAAEKLKVNWTTGTGLPKQSEFYESLRQAALARHADAGFQRHRADPGGRGHDAQIHLLSSVPDARIGGQFLRGGRCAGRPRHALFAHPRRLVSEVHVAR